MCEQLSDLSGPDFLDAVADAETAAGNIVNAATYRQRAKQWRDLERQHDAAVDLVADLDNARRRIDALEAQITQAASSLRMVA